MYLGQPYHVEKNAGKINDKTLRDIFDIRLFNEDGTFMENGGPTKPEVLDVDLTNYQTVCDLKNKKMWIKVPLQKYYVEWTGIDIDELWHL